MFLTWIITPRMGETWRRVRKGEEVASCDLVKCPEITWQWAPLSIEYDTNTIQYTLSEYELDVIESWQTLLLSVCGSHDENCH